MSPAPARARAAQAWVELRSDDPSAVSALRAIRLHLAEGRELRGLRRARLFELAGSLPARARLEELLHRSNQFYNPHKERCSVRRGPRDRLPVGATETTVVVWERGGGRRLAAERWLARETGRSVAVREATVWVLEWEPSVEDEQRMERTKSLAVVRDMRHGLLANPHAEDSSVHAGAPPLPAGSESSAGGRS
jgi:hypothetical protein